MEIAEVCEGCLSYYVSTDPWNKSHIKTRGCALNTPFISNTVKCPCIDCIVKMICDDMCDRFVEYKRISKLRYEFQNGRVDRIKRYNYYKNGRYYING